MSDTAKAIIQGGALGVAIVVAVWWAVSAGTTFLCSGNLEATEAAAARWVAAHMPPGTKHTCQSVSPCGNWSQCDASTADRSRVVSFDCTPDGCKGRRP